MARMWWKKKKTIAMYLNKRQAFAEDPDTTSGIEILIESGNFLVRESSTANNIQYIITE